MCYIRHYTLSHSHHTPQPRLRLLVRAIFRMYPLLLTALRLLAQFVANSLVPEYDGVFPS